MTRSTVRRIIAVLPLAALTAALLSCAGQPPRFKSAPDEMQHRETRGYPASVEMVWSATMEILDGYKIFTQDPVQGIILTNWRDTLTKNTGSIGGTWMHGVKVEERADTQDKRNMQQFLIRNRLHIAMAGNKDSTTVSVTNYFTARPKDFFERVGDDADHGSRSYSVSDFDTREQYVILNKIGEALEKAREKAGN